mgnify:CR=1 FL=1
MSRVARLAPDESWHQVASVSTSKWRHAGDCWVRVSSTSPSRLSTHRAPPPPPQQAATIRHRTLGHAADGGSAIGRRSGRSSNASGRRVASLFMLFNESWHQDSVSASKCLHAGDRWVQFAVRIAPRGVNVCGLTFAPFDRKGGRNHQKIGCFPPQVRAKKHQSSPTFSR